VSLVVHDFRGFSCHFPGKCGKCRRATVVTASALRPWDVFCVLAQNKNRKNMKKRKQSHTHLARTKSSRSSIHYHSKFWPETSLDSKKADTTKVYLLAKRASFNRFSMRGLLFVKKVGISGQCSSALCN